MVSGWLMPELKLQARMSSSADPEVPTLTGMNSSMARMAQKHGYTKWYGFDGSDGVTISPWMHYHDALMALAQILPLLADKKAHMLARSVSDFAARHEVFACPEEAKANVMRGLIESLDNHEYEVNDGVKIKSAAGWVVVRLCAGRPALEIFKFSRRGERAAEEETEALVARVRRNIDDCMALQKSS